jgi:hypothetical protein
MKATSQRARSGSIVLTCLWVLAVGLIVAAGRALYARTYLDRILHQTITVTPDVPLTRKDPIYGMRLVPGHFEVDIAVPEASAPYRFTMDIDADGYRVTSAKPDLHEGQPAVWIFGCSFTWGYPLDNQDTYPWLIQAGLPDHDVRNFGVHGVGNLRALRQLRELLEYNRREPPVLAVFAYASFHKARNVSGAAESAAGDITQGGHVVDFRTVLDEGALAAVDVPAEIEDPALREETRVTFAIFAELLALCRTHGIRPVLAVQHIAGSSDPVVEFAASLGFEIVPMTVNLGRAIYNVMPFDNHPNAAANTVFAEKLLPVLKRLLPEG